MTAGQVDQTQVTAGTIDERADRGSALLADDESGSPGALLRRGPLRTVLAALTAHGSSKPQGLAGGQNLGPLAFDRRMLSKAMCVNIHVVREERRSMRVE